jgi:hypothetical protein
MGLKAFRPGDWEVSARCTSPTNVSFLYPQPDGQHDAGGHAGWTFYAIVLPYTP